MTLQLRRRLAAVLGCFILLASRGSAQKPQGINDATLPRFEVASVKANLSGDENSQSRSLPDGGYVGVNITLRVLLLNAFRVPENQIVGVPNWWNTARFDINA